MATRADQLTEAIKKKVTYSDFTDNMDVHPITGALLVVTNETAVIRSVRHRLLTSFGERLYDDTFGCNVKMKLFEQNDNFLVEDIKNSIKNSLQNETRISIVDIVVVPDTNTVSVTLYFLLINTNTVLNTNILLQRVR